MSQELLICENNIMQLSFSYPRHQRFNEFILLFIFVNVSLRLLNVSPVILFPLFEFLYIRSEIIETITLTSLEKRPIIEISTKKTFNHCEILRFMTLFYSFLAGF